MTEIDLEDFKTFLIDELRFSPGTVNQTIRKMEYVLERVPSDSLPGFQAFIRSIWEKGNSNNKANGYIKIINHSLRFRRLPSLKYYKELEERISLVLYADHLFLSKSWLPPRENKVTTQRLPPHGVVRWLP